MVGMFYYHLRFYFEMVFNVRKRRKGRQALDRIIPAKGEYERNISFASMNTYETNANLDQ